VVHGAALLQAVMTHTEENLCVDIFR